MREGLIDLTALRRRALIRGRAARRDAKSEVDSWESLMLVARIRREVQEAIAANDYAGTIATKYNLLDDDQHPPTWLVLLVAGVLAGAREASPA